ncbi:MAG: glutamine-hydrolyzing carbamoyl-phosphate synthase small subunit [Peptostreptococcaceae bacterium]|nr:glutamine-hydrolyzing carbamoyl-phosphate synthase small subunit [Peptostreptococcaceae bacterium]
MKGYLILEDGTKFEGNIFGKKRNSVGEVVFNTGMTGYQETLTDSSYYGQIVILTYPLVGNYGITLDDNQSEKPKVRGFIVREASVNYSNWRGMESIDEYLNKNDIVGLEGIDTRALTKIIREKGTMTGKIVAYEDGVDVMEELKAFDNSDAVHQVTTKFNYDLMPITPKVAVVDYGIKRNILNALVNRNIHVRVFSCLNTAEEILDFNPDGIFLSNGPGDPAFLKEEIETVKELIGKKPIFGICLGHQLLAHAFGGETKKMKYGHGGCNHPVKDLAKDRVFITSQNHGYEVVAESLDKSVLEITHVNMNDNTIEGVRHLSLPIFSVQFHPEASPGPSDSDYLFDEFLNMIKKENKHVNI